MLIFNSNELIYYISIFVYLFIDFIKLQFVIFNFFDIFFIFLILSLGLFYLKIQSNNVST